MKQIKHLRTHRKGPKRGLKFKAGSKVLIRKPAAKFVVWEYKVSDVTSIKIGLFPEEAEAIFKKYPFIGPLSVCLRSPQIFWKMFHVSGRIKLVLSIELARILNNNKVFYRENGRWYEDFESIRGAMWRLNKFERKQYASWAKKNLSHWESMIKIYMSPNLFKLMGTDDKDNLKIEVLK